MSTTMRRIMSAVVAALAVLLAIAAALLLTGHNAIVVTHGVSMNPLYYQGDMVVVARMPSYHVGQIVAYHMQGRDFVVLHRIIGGDAGGFVFKGDNNQSTDPTRPTQKELLGRAVLHIPAGGLWLERITSPTALSTYAFLLLAGAGPPCKDDAEEGDAPCHAQLSTARSPPPWPLSPQPFEQQRQLPRSSRLSPSCSQRSPGPRGEGSPRPRSRSHRGR